MPKISQLPEAAGLSGPEQLPVTQGGQTRRATVSQVVTAANAAIASGTAPDAGTLTGAEYATVSRGSGVLKTTLTAIAQWVLQTYQGFTQSGAGAVARTVQDKLRDIINVKDFGVIGDGQSHPLSERYGSLAAAQVKYPHATALSDEIDWAAIQAAINYASALPRGARLDYLAGLYVINRTLYQTASYVSHQGKGKSVSLFVTTGDFDALVIGTNPITPMVGVDVLDIGFYHTNAVPKTTRHLVTICPLQSTFRNSFTNGAFGHVIYGGQGINIDGCIAPGNYDPVTNPVLNSENGITLLAASTLGGYTLGAGAVDLPTEVYFNGVYINGPQMKGWRHGVAIHAGEQVVFTGGSYIGQSTVNNLRIEQDANNKLILEVTVDESCYMDAAGQGSVWVGGPAGNGSQYIGSVVIDGTVKGQGGDGQSGIVFDGTNRGGSFPQAILNAKIRALVSGFITDGIYIGGGENIDIDAKSWGNSFDAVNQGSGLHIGPNVNGCDVTGRYGGDTFGRGTGNQTYGVYIDPAAQNVHMEGANLKGNQLPTNGVSNAGTSKNRIIDCPGFNGNRPAVAPSMPASGAAFVNPYGSPCQVLIYGGTVSAIALNGQNVFGSAPGVPIMVTADDTLSITYSAAPSWVWWPQ